MAPRNTRRRRGALFPIVLLLAALAAQRGRAEVVVELSRVTTSIQVMSGVFDFAFASPLEQAQSPVTNFTAELEATPAGPFPATARASQTASVEATPGNVTVAAEGASFVRVPGVPEPPLSNLFAQSQNSMIFSFRVTQRATVTASAQAVGSELSDAASIVCFTEQGVVERRGTSVSVSAQLGPDGSCLVSALLIVTRRGNLNFLDPGEREGTLRVNVSVSETEISPEEGTVFRWVGPAQGDFGDQANWENENGGEGVPGFQSFEDADTAIVEGETALDLDLGGGLSRAALPRGVGVQKTGRMAVRSTQILRPIGGTLILDSLEPGIGARSLEIGGARLVLDQGGVTARHAVVGQGGNAELEVVGPDGFFTTVGRFGIGGDSDGLFTIRDGAQVTSAETVLGEQDGVGSVDVAGTGTLWQTGNLAVGFADTGALRIQSGARVESQSAFVDCQLSAGPDVPGCTGLDGDERAEVIVTGAGSSWKPGDLELGARGKVLVEGGALLDPSLVRIGTSGTEASCVAGLACLEVSDGSVDADGISIGHGGAGNLRIGAGGRVTGLAGVLIGNSPGSRGNAVVVGPSAEPQLTGSLLIGTAIDGSGELVLENGAQVSTDNASIGGEPGSFGLVEIRAASPGATVLGVRANSIFDLGVDLPDPEASIFGPTGEIALAGGRIELVDAELNIHNTGEVSGTGSIEGSGVVSNDGVLGCGVVVNAPYIQGPEGVLQCAQAAPPAAPQLNPLAATRFARALRARPVPPPPPPPGPFVVTGDATLDGTLVLQFLNGFAPFQDDAFELLDVSGNLTGSFAEVAVRGLAPGAEFAQDLVDGRLTLTFLADAESLPVVSVKAKPSLREGKPKKGLKVKVSRQGDTSQALAVRYVLRGTAANGLDYEQLPGVIEIPAGKKRAKLALRAFPDGVTEGVETVSLEILPGDDYTTSLFSKVAVALEDEKAKRR